MSQYSVSITIIIIITTTVLVTNTVTYSVNNNISITSSVVGTGPSAAPPTQSTSILSFAVFNISPISTDTMQRIIITGVGFGNGPTVVVNSVANDSSINTLRDSVHPSVLINDRTGNWSAGYAQTSTDYDHVGIYLTSWSDTQIIIDGFGSLLGNATNPSQYLISTGDLITVTVYGPNQIGIASLDTAVT